MLKKKNININILKNIVRVLLDNTEYFSKYYDINESKNILKHKRKRDNYDINNIDTKFIKIKNNNKLQLNYELKKYGEEKNELFEDDVDDNNINDDGHDNDKEIDKDNKLNKSIEEKFCDSFNKLLEEGCFMDLSRKIKWSDIDFESKPYNIWDINTIDNNFIESDNE